MSLVVRVLRVRAAFILTRESDRVDDRLVVVSGESSIFKLQRRVFVS